MKKLFTGLFALTLLFGSTTGAFAATITEKEPNDSWEQAQSITIGSTVKGVGDEDRFTFVASKSGSVTLKTTFNGEPHTHFSGVYDDQMNNIGQSSFGNSITFNVVAGKTYKLVQFEMFSATPYTFTLSYN